MINLDRKITKKMYDSGAGSSIFWITVSRRGLFGFLIAFLGIWFISPEEFRLVFVFSLSIAVAFLTTLLVRYIVKRKRPNFGSLYKPMLNSYSFPSAHASVAFAMATSLSLFSLELWTTPVVWLGVAFLFGGAISISVSRIYVGVHYLGDVIWGALIGILTSVILIGL